MKHMSIHVFVYACVFVHSMCAKWERGKRKEERGKRKEERGKRKEERGKRETRAKTEKAEPGGE
jgi:hypothetical protein